MKAIGTINNYRSDLSGWTGAGIMLGFAVFAGYRWHTTGLIFFGLLVIRDLAASCFLISRKPSKEKVTSRLSEVLAYLSSAWPFLYLDSYHSLPEAELISAIVAIVGFTLSTLALFDLGRSFGVSPANRGIVRSGLYRYIRHPMYAGYVISELGFVFLNPFNLIIYFISIGFYLMRAKLESKILKT